MNKFEEFLNKLEYEEAEIIIKSAGFENVDVYDHVVWDNEDGAIEEFLKYINTRIIQYNIGYCLLECENKLYKIPYVESARPDRTMALIFLKDKIYDVTENFK